MDEGSDQTGESDDGDDDDDDEYDETTNLDDVDCESTFYYGPRGQSSGRLCRRNVATRSGSAGGCGGKGKDNSTFRIRSKWKKYHYQAIPRAMTIQEEEDEEIAGPSTSAATDSNGTGDGTTPASTTRGAATNFSLEYLPHNSMRNPNRTIQIPNVHVTMANERNRHVIIHVNDMELSQDDNDCDDDDDDDDDDGNDGVQNFQLSDDDDEDGETVVYKKSIFKHDSLLVAYDSNSVSSV